MKIECCEEVMTVIDRPGWMDSRDTKTSLSGCTSTQDASVLVNDNEDDVFSAAAAATGLVI